MGFERNDEFEQELRQAFERRPAPPRLKRKLMEEVRKRQTSRLRRPRRWWPRFAVAAALVVIAVGSVLWRQAEERREGEAVRRQVLTAFRITGHALNEMNSKLAARDRGQD
ncbi:MAG: hypothetical protein WBE76_24695 [Terracidiphilus sp.]